MYTGHTAGARTEWVSDFWEEPAPPFDVVNPDGPAFGINRTYKMGSHKPLHFRSVSDETYGAHYTGFRCCADLD